jgi:hypothetical protein
MKKLVFWIENFSFVVAVASLVVMTITLYRIMQNGSVQVSAPFGEAPLEIAASLFAASVIMFTLLRRLGLTRKRAEKSINRIFALSLVFFFLGCVFMNMAHFITVFGLTAYPDYIIETNPIAESMFKNYGFQATFVAFNIAYLAITGIIYAVIFRLSKKNTYPFNIIIANAYLVTGMTFFMMFMMNFVSDAMVLRMVASYAG